MPTSCCVPFCRSNYQDKDNRSVFKFPSSEKRPVLRRKWIRCVHRKNLLPTKTGCLQNGRQKEGTSASNQQKQRKSSWKTDANSRSMPAAGSQGANADNSRTRHGRVVLPKKRQQIEEKSTGHTKQRKKLNRAHLQTATTENSASSGKLSSLTTEEKLNRISDAQRTKQGYNNVGKIQSKSITQVDSGASDKKGIKDHVFETLSNKKERWFKFLNKNMKDAFNKPSTPEALSNEPIDANLGHAEQLMGDKHSENNNLTQKQPNNVNVARLKKNNQRGSSIIRNSLQLSSIGTVKLNNQSLLAKDQNKSSKIGHKTPSENNSGAENVGTTTGRVNVQKLRGSKNRNPVKKNGFHRRKEFSMNDRYFADETRNGYVSKVERVADLKVSSRRQGESVRNRLVRPSAADRLEQQISPDLSNSYRRLMDRMRKILRMFSESMEKLELYKAEIFNGTRYTIMMGTRGVLEELRKANDYIYDGMTSATQFTFETILKFHNNQHAAKTGKLQEVPIDVTESAVDKRNFQPNLERAQREQSKAQADIGKVNAMQMKCQQGESRLKQVRDLFHINYDRPILQDLYGYLNISIHRINRGLIMPPQLRQLRRRKFYLDHVKDMITTANSLLIDSTDAFQKAIKQTKENYDTFKNWLQKESSKHHGVSRTSSQGLNSYHIRKLRQLVSQAKIHARELHRQYNSLHSALESPLDAARLAVNQTGKIEVQFDFKLVTTNLKLLLKDMLSSLDDLRIHIGSKIKLTWAKQCLSDIEGSGLIDTDDEDLCEEEGSGIKNSDSEKVFATDNEDFTFIDEPVENTRPAKHSIQQFGIDLADFTSKLVHSSRQIHDNALTLQGPLEGLQQQLNNIQSSISSVERSTDTQKNVILDFHDNARHVQEVKQRIPDISQKLAALRNLNLEDAVNKAKQAVEKSRHPSRVDQKLFQETSSDIKKIDKDRKAEISKMDDDFDYSGLFKQGQEIVSNYADITLLQSMTVESCGKIGNHFTYIKSNMSLLRQKVEKAREILTTLQLSVSKSGTGYISVPIPKTHPEVTASLTSSITACVKPKTLDGPFLFVRGNNSASYGVSLDSENIAVTAYDKENNDLQTVTLDQLSITEEWYTLEIKRTGETLSVMAVSQGGKTQTKRAMIGGLDLIQPPPLAAYLGGMPENLRVISGSWEGCVGNLMVNGRALTLFNSDSKGVQPSLCTDHCISDKQRLSMVFSGNGFARFIPSANERITLIALNFRTRQKMASLFSLINRRQNFYLSVVMDNGTVKIESSIPGERILLLSLTSSLNDGHSHTLRVIYRGSRTYPELDGNKEAFSVERAAPQIFTDLLDGVLIGAHVLHSKQFLITPYRPLIGCIGDVFINDDRLVLPDAVSVYNVFPGNCNSSDIWHSCWQWTDQSKKLSFGVVDNSNRISFLVSRDSFGTLIHFMKKDKFDIEVSLSVSGIDVSSENSESVLIRPAADKSYFTLITFIDDGNGVSVKAWDQNVHFAYGFWGYFSTDLKTPHTVVIGESREGLDRTFTGSISQFTIEDRFYDLSQFSLSHNLTPCERPQEDIQPSPPPLVADEPFSCV